MALAIDLRIHVDTLFVRLHGEMDEYTASDLRYRLNEVISRYRIHNVVFNMERLSFMDSSGIGVILGRYNQLKHQNGQIVLCSLSESIKRIVRISGLEKICTIKETEDTAKWFLRI